LPYYSPGHYSRGHTICPRLSRRLRLRSLPGALHRRLAAVPGRKVHRVTLASRGLGRRPLVV